MFGLNMFDEYLTHCFLKSSSLATEIVVTDYNLHVISIRTWRVVIIVIVSEWNSRLTGNTMLVNLLLLKEYSLMSVGLTRRTL